MRSDFDIAVSDVTYACTTAVNDFRELVEEYVGSMNPGTHPMAENQFVEKAQRIVKDLFERADDILDSPTIAHEALIRLKRRP